MKRIFILLLMFCSVTTVFSQNITRAEYFFDTDPGPGHGTPITITGPADSVSFSADITTTGLSNGFHYLSVRVRDAEGIWSRFESRNFYILNGNTTNAANITGAECFFDADPGPGGGFQIPVGTSGENVTFTAMIPANLSGGFHWLGMRTKDADGKWGLFERRSFYVNPIPTDMTSVVAAEYFFDHDPGVGSGTPLSFATPGDDISQPFMIPVPAGMSAGDHFLTIRAKDQAGNWSLFEKDTLTIGAASNSISCPANVTIDAAGQCSAVVNNIDPVITPAGSAYIYTLSGATTGSGTGTASGKTFNAGVTTVTYALFNSPSTNCSFTVTVNSGITPTININASGTEICPGQQVVFTTIQFNGGANPSYQWKLNGNNIPGATNATYQSTSLTDGDLVSVSMTSSLGCANPQTVESYTILINVSSSVAALVNLGISATTICTGTPVNFIAMSTNGGISPTYQWKLNGNIIPGVTGSTYQSSTLANGDHVTVTMTSSLACANPQTATATGFTMTVTSTLPPSVYLESSFTTICAGTTATFYANPTNGGTNPSYQWKVNGNNVGSDSYTYSSSSLHNGDIVTVAMTSSLGCASPQSALSSPTIMTVLPSSPASVNINASSTTICAGTTVTFNVTPVTTGASYQWQLNGNNIPGATGTTYQSSSLQNGDKIKVMSTQSSQCFSSSSVASNEITISVNAAVTPSVIIGASATTICPGTSVTFTATPVNGGTPTYSWRKNGIPVPGNESNVFQSSLWVNGDKITCVMTSTLPCASEPTGISNEITITVIQNVVSMVTIVPVVSTICSGTTVTFTASPTNGGPDPSYQWKVNGNNVNGNSVSYETAALNDGDIVSVVMTSSLECASPSSVSSGGLTITVLESSPAFVNIVASATTICSGTAVTFTASPTGGGNSTYQWKLNGNNIPGATGTTYQSSSLQNGDKIKLVMTPLSPCSFSSPATSNEITMTVNSAATPSVSIEASATTICPGEMVTFTATPVNAGNNIAYEWILNSNVVGSNSPTYQNASLANGDKIKLTMTSSQACGGYSQAVSNTINMTVGSGVAPSVSINASAIDICAGQQVTFTATPTNGGNNPTYQWKLNGNNVGSNNPTYHTTSLENADTIKVVMTSSLGCVTSPAATSNSISMDVSTSVLSSVSIAADRTYICQGELISFTATPTNGGNPTYEWKVNGVSVATTNSNTYQSSALEDGNFIVVWMTTSLGCASPLTVPSNTIVMNVSSQLTYYRDLDGDGYGNASSGTTQACGPNPGWVASNTDCNDNNATVYPGATEVCGNNVDDDCDGQVDGCNATNPPVLILRTYPVKEGDAGQTILNVEVSLDIPAPLPVSVQYSTINDDAIAGADYIATSGSLTIPAGSISGSIQVRIIGDLLRENNERFRINFTNPVNAVLNGDPNSRVMIIDNDKGKGSNATTRTDQTPIKEEIFKIPTVTKRNQVWVIPQIGSYENEVLIVNVQGQLVSRFVNYHNQTALGNVSAGLYFYRIRIMEVPGQYKYYSGRLLITE